MALIVIYLISTVLIFIKAEPFTVTGVLLSICFLPGLSFLALARPKKLYFEDILLAFPVSVGISSIVVITLLFMGVQISYIPIIIHVIVGTAAIFHIFTRHRQKTYAIVEINKQELLFSLFSLFVILVLSIPFLLGPNRPSISAHGFHHSLLVTQILNGIFPPENPGLGGTGIGYYWGFHALVAALTVNTSLQQLQIMFMLNAISLYFVFCISCSIAKRFDLPGKYCYIMPIAIIGLMRMDAGILFLLKFLSGHAASFKTLTAAPQEPYEILSVWTRGLPWIDSRQFALHKLYNVSGMQLAVSLCYSYMFILLRREFYSNKTCMISAALIISACFFNYPPLAIFLLFFVPLWVFYIFISIQGNFKERIRQASRIAIPYIAAGIIVSPYMLYIMAGRAASSGGQGGIFSFDFYDQSIKNMVVFMVPMPIIVYGALVAMKRFALSREFYFLAIGTVLCLVLTVFTRWPFNNSYKFNYVLPLFYSLLSLLALNNLLSFITSKWFRRLSTAVLVFFLALTPIIVESSHMVSSFSTDYVYLFNGRHLIYAQDRQKNEAYEWIHENTPFNALIMLTYTETNWPCCGLGNNYEAAAIAERTLYVIRDDDYTVSNPEYAKRIAFRKKLFENPEDPSVIDFFRKLNRPVYLLIEDNLDESRFFVEDRFKPYSYEPGKEFELLYQNDKQRIYNLQLF